MQSMKKKGLMALLLAMFFLAGCTQETTGEQQETSGVINYGYSMSPMSIRQGDLSVMTITLSNHYTNNLENVQIRFEPTFSGITFRTDGPSIIESGNTGTWVVDIQTDRGIIPREYVFRPIICFDYLQEKRGFFRINNDVPSTSEVDYASSDMGPLIISFNNLRGINARSDFNSLDFSITYAFANNYNGLTPYYLPETQSLGKGMFELESHDLGLRALQGSARLDPRFVNIDPASPMANYCSQISGERDVNRCYFEHSDENKVYASSQFGFRVNVSKTLESEMETYFLHELDYNICFKSSEDIRLTVVRAD